MTLHFQKFGQDTEKSPLVFIHGLFGSSSNWRSIAKSFSDDRLTYAIDLRNHGQSAHLPSHTYLDLAADIQEFVVSEGLNNYVLCGHSMGGKAVMTNALLSKGLKLENSLKAIIVLDIAPVVYEHSHSNNLTALKALNLSTIKSRADADKLLKETIPDTGVRLFFLQSLERDGSEFKWRLNLDTLAEFMPDIVGFPENMLSGKVFNKPSLFAYGGKSEFVTEASYELIKQQFSSAVLDEIEGAGHWIHIDKRDEMMASINRFLSSIDS